MKKLLLCLTIATATELSAQEVSGELKKWHKITITFDGPQADERDEYNPFLNYRLNVAFTHGATGKTYVVPGHFAADGNAGNSSATAGNQWRVHFAPDQTGEWSYAVDFRKGRWVAVSEKQDPGVSGAFMDGVTGSFYVGPTDKTGRDFRSKGRLQYVGERYLKFAETAEYFLKSGPDAPENLLAYQDFDGTFHNDGHKDHLVKTWEAHLQDWKEGDPTWKEGKGKALIGAVNYIASKGMNVFSFLTLNIVGDDQNVFPYVDYNTYDRMDISKLDQWEVLFGHADRLGLFLHFKTQEAENQGLLDGGGVGVQRKLYYRELIARFSHHLALNWNLGEENGDWVKNHKTPPQFKYQRLAMAQYFYDHDPYRHHVVIHNGNKFDDLLGPEAKLTGVSVQTHHQDFRLVHPFVIEWIEKSDQAGKPWAVAVDEPGDAQHSLVPDKDDPDHHLARQNALWGALTAGAWGLEWYFGYKHDHSDLTCEDWRSRDRFWDQCKIALDFFEEHLPYWEMENKDSMLSTEDYCFAKEGDILLVYLRNGGSTQLDLSDQDGKFSVQWFNPRTGEFRKKTGSADGGSNVRLEAPSQGVAEDWAVLLKKE